MNEQQPGQPPYPNNTQPPQSQSPELKPGDPGYSRTITTMSEAAQAAQTPGAEQKKPSKVLIVIVTIIVIIGATAAAIGITQCRAQQHADKYGADAPYTVTGVVEKADKDTRGKTDTYKTVIKTEEELPDGSHEFVSTHSIDQMYAKKAVGQTVKVEIGTDGHIDKITVIE